jgi:2-polyprenyl-6-methoxyphenol hydroxylase-like FAD-dependent oxidoreductase
VTPGDPPEVGEAPVAGDARAAGDVGDVLGPSDAPEVGGVRDVAIVGAGAVGLLLGCLLAQRGVDVVVLERRTTPGERTRAIGIHPPGLRALDAAGLGARVREVGVPIRDGVVTCQGRTLGRLAFDEEPVWSLPQHETEQLLERRLADLAPDALRRGVAVIAVTPSSNRLDLRVSDADTRRSRRLDAESGGAECGGAGDGGAGDGVAGDGVAGDGVVRARYVVGADGVRSRVRELAGIGWERRRGSAEYVMGDTDDPTQAPATALLRFEPAGVVESFPLPGDRRRWVAWVRRTPSPLTPSALATIVAARTGTSVDLAGATEPSAFTARQHLADRFAQGRVALVGDAAHEVSPIGGQGMNLGWLDAVRLDDALARALAEGAPDDPFGGYAHTRRNAALRATRQAAFNMAMGAPAAGFRLRARNRLVRLLAVWPLRRVLASAFTMRRL